tara:strand:+ start:19140 stop:19475 length:336 start_codon:yes stop_codon:yes gene_type:complete
MSLKQAVRDALVGNDVDVHAKLYALRIECRERGIHTDEVTRIVRSVLNEDSKPAAMPEPEAPQPVTPEASPVIQDRRADKELSRRVQFSGEPVQQRKDSDSMILRMADDKK